jgi:hypothetical protein
VLFFYAENNHDGDGNRTVPMADSPYKMKTERSLPLAANSHFEDSAACNLVEEDILGADSDQFLAINSSIDAERAAFEQPMVNPSPTTEPSSCQDRVYVSYFKKISNEDGWCEDYKTGLRLCGYMNHAVLHDKLTNLDDKQQNGVPASSKNERHTKASIDEEKIGHYLKGQKISFDHSDFVYDALPRTDLLFNLEQRVIDLTFYTLRSSLFLMKKSIRPICS